MASKFIVLAFFVAAVSGGNVGSSSFSYGVADPHTGDVKSQHESRIGNTVKGQYSLLESDGTKRVVDYSANPLTGFNAVVRKDPAGIHPSPLGYSPLAQASPLAYGGRNLGANYASPLVYAGAGLTQSYSNKIVHPSYTAPSVYGKYAAPSAYRSYAAPSVYDSYASPLAYSNGYPGLTHGAQRWASPLAYGGYANVQGHGYNAPQYAGLGYSGYGAKLAW